MPSCLRQRLQRRRLGLGHLLDAVLVAHHADGLGVEDLHRGALGLLHHLAAVLGVGVVAVVGALVDEALAVQVDDDADGVRVLLEVVEHHAVAEGRRADVPLHRVARRPAAEGLRVDLERGAQAVAGVVARAAHPARLPARPVVAHAHLGVGLEAAAGEHHVAAVDVGIAAGPHDVHAGDRARAVLQQPPQAGGVADLDAEALGLLDELVDQAPAAADRLDVHPAVEVVLALDLEGLPAEHREEAHALAAHPAHRVARAADEQLGQRVVGLALGHAPQVVEVALLAHAPAARSGSPRLRTGRPGCRGAGRRAPRARSGSRRR